MKRYVYSGPPSGVTIGDREVLLQPGAAVELDPDHDYTRTLIALGHLHDGTVEVATAPAPVQPRRPRKEPV